METRGQSQALVTLPPQNVPELQDPLNRKVGGQ